MLHNSLTEERLNLFCLVDGEATSNVFSVDVTVTDTVHELKGAIKAKKTPEFDDIATDELTLWCVSVKDDSNDSLPIVLDSLPEKTKLRATSKLFDVFEESPSKKMIHVIIQRPPQVHRDGPADASSPHLACAWDRSRSGSLMQPRLVRGDNMDEELAIVLKAANGHYTTPVADPKVVEDFQRERLGPFFKRALPYHETATGTSLVMLGVQLDKQAKTSDGDTLHSIVENDIGKLSGHHVVAMVAPSGSGKTAAVVDLASKHYVVYCVCSSPNTTTSPDFEDSNFVALAKDVERIYRNRTDKEPKSLHELLTLDLDVKTLIGERVEVEILARLLFLQFLLNKNADLEPKQFFREQTTAGGAATIAKLFGKLQGYESLAIRSMLRNVQAKLQSLLVLQRRGLVIAVDEAQVAVNDILAGKLISPSALIDNRNNRDAIFDSKYQMQLKYRRGFLTPLSATLGNMQATLVILGTALSLLDADHVCAAIAKPTNFIWLTDFPYFDEDDVKKMLSDLIELSDCDIPSAKLRKLSGRPRFTINFINILFATGSI
ncbi:hypothetical protein BGZ89_000656 [Linnemannia elongata]|nr:hypothetical protein BGZ89_000656 [Linnemannia elongata]